MNSSTYRIQFNKNFTFRDALDVLPYLNELGISSVYASPILSARSEHGYDIQDPAVINPEIGSLKDFDTFCEYLKKYNLELIVDMVPNHMGILGEGNKWWWDILESGQDSIYAHYFDISWDSQNIKNKVLIPILGDNFGHVLENQEIRLIYEQGSFKIKYYEHKLPIAPGTYQFILEHNLDGLIDIVIANEVPCHSEPPSVAEQSRLIEQYRALINLCKSLPKKQLHKTNESDKIEKNKKKSIVKKRLDRLVVNSPPIRDLIERNLKIFNGTRNDSKSFDLLDNLLDKQAYRLTNWRMAAEEINYRRFFNVNELAAIKMENEDVFDQYHALILKLVQENKIQGLRLDHTDGLYNPDLYFRKLQSLLQSASGRDKSRLVPTPFFIVVEKILEKNEELQEQWEISGTVGYEHLNALNGLFVKSANEKRFNELYENFIKQRFDFAELVYLKKKLFALVHLASEVNSLGSRLYGISSKNRHYRDFAKNNLTLVIRETLACFPVYRTYISGFNAVSDDDRKYINFAVEKAKKKTPALNPRIYDFLKEVLLLEVKHIHSQEEKNLYLDFTMRFQQLSGAIMAKGLEDTTFYIYNRLTSLNEVGGDPSHFGVSIEDFHQQNTDRLQKWPLNFITTSTHDTKRSEDVRMRINALSEIPDEWSTTLSNWAVINKKHKTLIDGVLQPENNAEYFLYQTLIGVCIEEENFSEAFAERICNYALKAVREAKTDTSWLTPNSAYEDAIKDFILKVLSSENTEFSKSFFPFKNKISYYGTLNSLAALVLKIGSPGIVDTYQGNEIFTYNLVDPDNRMPVDYTYRSKLLSNMHSKDKSRPVPTWFFVPSPHGEYDTEQANNIKLYIMRKGLNLRRQFPELFLYGEYIPLEVQGIKKEHVIAFLRIHKDKILLVAAARFFTNLQRQEENQDVWQDTKIIVKDIGVNSLKLVDIFTGAALCCEGASGGQLEIAAAQIFKRLGFGVLIS